MNTFSLIKKNSYFDSVTLMGISKRLSTLEGVEQVSVSMGTELNRTLLQDSGMNTPETDSATPNDLMIVFTLAAGGVQQTVLEEIEKALTRRAATTSAQHKPAGLKSALDIMPDANMAIISLPGQYAAFEAQKALKNNMHVMLFSDNVSLEEERALKQFAHEKGLLVMGPDCGTAIINQKGLCFANVVRKGRVGLVGASGTGMQEVTVLLDHNGVGISQAIGVGGRDLSEAIGAIMTCDALEALHSDAETDVIILVSKPPYPSVAEKVRTLAAGFSKPVVLCFLQETPSGASQGNVHFASTLEEGAIKACALMGVSVNVPCGLNNGEMATLRAKLQPAQKQIRGIFCGGTLTEEARIEFKRINASLPCYSNTSKKKEEQLVDPHKCAGNCFVDMGDDAFTVGKPHPMIAPELRSERMAQEAADPACAVILFDVVLGYGSHESPAEVALEGVAKARAVAKARGQEIIFVAYVLGSEQDPQSKKAQEVALQSAGVLLGATNAHAARMAAQIIKEAQ